MPNLNPREVAKALVVRLRAIQAFRAETIASTDLSADQKLNAALRLSDARTNLVGVVSGLLKEEPRTPGAVTVPALSPDTIEIADEDDDEGEEEDPPTPSKPGVGGGSPARARTTKKMPAPAQPGVNKTAQSATPVPVLLERLDRVTAAIEARTEAVIVEADLHEIDNAKRAIVAHTTLDPELRLHHLLTLNLLRERRARQRKKASAPDRSTADAEARLARRARALN